MARTIFRAPLRYTGLAERAIHWLDEPPKINHSRRNP
jgi:hypothetical protein